MTFTWSRPREASSEQNQRGFLSVPQKKAVVLLRSTVVSTFASLMPRPWPESIFTLSHVSAASAQRLCNELTPGSTSSAACGKRFFKSGMRL